MTEPLARPAETSHVVEVDRNGLQVLDRAECLSLLGGARLGRIGITDGALPTILPINFRLLDERIVFRTGVGTKLAAATSNAVVAFEVDEMDPLWHTGWSVVVTGMARTVERDGEHARLEAAEIPYWAPAGGDRLVEISTDIISGRRLAPGVHRPR